MKTLTGINIVVLGLILWFGLPIAASAYPKLITPTSLERGYSIQIASTTAQLKLIQADYAKCNVLSTVGSLCAKDATQIKSLTEDLHILEVTYHLMDSALQAPLPVYQ
jgi:hypothetical protein